MRTRPPLTLRRDREPTEVMLRSWRTRENTPLEEGEREGEGEGEREREREREREIMISYSN